MLRGGVLCEGERQRRDNEACKCVARDLVHRLKWAKRL